MPYATVTDLLDRLGEVRLVQLTDLTRPQTRAVNTTVAGRALDDASAEIDGYLMGRYPVPITADSALAALRGDCVTLAHYRLLGDAAAANIAADVKAIRDKFDRIARGVALLLPAADAPAVAGVGPVLFNPGSKVMGREV